MSEPDLQTWLEQDQERTQQEAAAQWKLADYECQVKGVGYPLPLRHFIAAHDQRLMAEVARRARQQSQRDRSLALKDFADSLDQVRETKA